MPDDPKAVSREWNSAVYHRLSQPQVSWGTKVLSRLSLRGDETILDAGCGTGRLTAELLQALPRGRVVGVDLSQNMLAAAQEHLRSQGDARISLVAADLLGLPFERSFQGIVSTAAFHWVLDDDLLFLNLRRALVSGGWLEAQCGGGPNLMALRKRVESLADEPQFSPYFQGFREPWLFQDAEEAANSMGEAGFLQVETSIEPALTVLEDTSHYSEFVRNIILRQHLQCIPREDIRAQFMAILTEMASKDNPPFVLDYWRLNLRGRVP